MKKRILSILCLLGLCVTMLAGCRCVPSENRWYVLSFQKNESFINGGERLVIHTGHPSARDPFAGMAEGFVSISFMEDGTMTFEPGTGEVLTGRYTYEHNGSVETKVFVTLDNGETFTCTARSNSYGSSLTCSFRDLDYLFEGLNMDPREYYKQNLQQLCDSIRYWCTETDGEVPVKPCNIIVRNGYFVVTADSLAEAIRLDETVAVRCFSMDADNQLQQLEEIREGECFYVAEKMNELVYITLYYVDPA